MVKIKNLSFSYAKKTVLRDISMIVSQGERLAIIGRNGVGKSTLIRCIAGIERDFTGNVKIKDRDIHTLKPRTHAKLVAYVPQAYNHNLTYTVFDYVLMGRFPYLGFMASATQQDRKYVKDALELTDTSSIANCSMNTLSGGELQRVFLAGAVSQHSDILLLDEPTTFLDPLHQELITKALERIHNEYNCTIITVTHDINSALFNNDKVLALVDGMVYYYGESNNLIEESSSTLKDIFGIPFFKGSCEKNGRCFVFV